MMLVVGGSILLALFALACLAGARALRRPQEPDIGALIDRIDALLPQTQCTRCGYPACKPYAEAIARNEAPINRCPPGGEDGIRALAALTGQPVQPLDPECGEETPPRIAIIDEDVCIGCTKCIQACPVDAVVGAAKLMHTVIPQLCTGCELCIPPCPVDCIDMVEARTEARQSARPKLPHAA
jgi:electron transport complex protein RnfB